MMKNMSMLDRVIRAVVVAAIIVLWLTDILTGTWLIVAIVIGVIFLITSAIGFCPLYRMIGKTFGTKRPAAPAATPTAETPTQNPPATPPTV